MRTSKTKVGIINAGEYAPQLTMADLKATFRGAKQETWFRAVMQLIEGQRQLCQMAAERRANIGDQATFELGASACCRDLLDVLAQLQDGSGGAGLSGQFK